MSALTGRAQTMRCKCVLVGPVKSGKTTIANFLAENTDLVDVCDYRPTKGARIVEFESTDLIMDGQKMEYEIEMWDCSGDVKYRDCWPAIRHGAEAIIMVVNPDTDKGTDLLTWYDDFVVKTGITTDKVLVLINEIGEKRTNDSAISEFRIPPEMHGSANYVCNIDRDSEAFRLEMVRFFIYVLNNQHDKTF